MSIFAGQPAETGVDKPLVSAADFQEWFSITSSSTAQDARIETAIEIASNIVRTGRRIFSAIDDDIVTIDGPGGCELLLPSDRLPVRSISTITNLATSGTQPDVVVASEYDWTASGVVTLHRDASIGRWWTARRRGIVVTYSHGYPQIPAAVAGIVLDLAKRLYDNPTGSTVRSETIGDYSVTYDSTAGGLLPAEEQILRQYEVPA